MMVHERVSERELARVCKNLPGVVEDYAERMAVA